MKLAIVGASGLVGQEILKVLEEFNFPFDELILTASKRSIGKQIVFRGNTYTMCSVEDAINSKPDIAIFSAGGSASKELAPRFAQVGCKVIDNSSAWRMNSDIPLVVPEVNGHTIQANNHIIANPNCSTIQLVAALCPLHKIYGIKRVVVSTYQSVTGSGVKGVNQLNNEREGINGEKAYPHSIDNNALPHGGDFLENGYTTEEVKLINETRKILEAPDMSITSTVVRVPVKGGHSESVNIEFENEFDLKEVKSNLAAFEGIVIQDDPANNVYPMPITAQGRNEIFIGRIRRDNSVKYGLNLWIVADNLRKGAATNTVQIAKYLINNQLI
ncbi:MAG: aspartate-semialdehyde dehydrogenase [Hyphomicrobiales bacterium]